MASTVAPSMAVTSIQSPLMHLFHHQPTDMTVFGPVLQVDLENTVFASRIPQFAKEKSLCIGVDALAKCKAIDHLTEQNIRECNVIVRPCDELEIDSDAEVESEDEDFDSSSQWDSDEEEVEDISQSESVERSQIIITAIQDEASSPTAVPQLLVERAGAQTIPQSVQDALINDKNAPRSLAHEFSGHKSPDWYKRLSKEQKELFLAKPKSGPKHKPTPTRPDAPLPTPYCNSRRHSDKELRDQYEMDARVAKHMSSIAKHHSKLAKAQKCSALATQAKSESAAAATASAAAKKNLKDLKAKHRKVKTNSSSTSASVPKSSAILSISATIAIATLGLALYL